MESLILPIFVVIMVVGYVLYERRVLSKRVDEINGKRETLVKHVRSLS